MGNIDSITSIKGKEPWLAVSLSWIIPRLGQFYAKNYYKAAFFCITHIVFYIVGCVSLLLTNLSIFWTLVIGLIDQFGIRLPSCFDAFYDCRRFNLQVSQINKSSGKDPWLSAFLSLLFPGLGQLYFRKVLLCLVYFIIYFMIVILPMSHQYSFLILPILRIVSGFHAYFIGKKYQIHDVNNEIIIWSIISSATILFWVVIPLLISFFIVGKSTCMGDSMLPTLNNNNGVIIDKLTIRFNGPKIGDIIFLKYPASDEYIKEHPKFRPRVICKRIVAKIGEEVFVKDNDLYVNGKIRLFDIPNATKGVDDYNEINNNFYKNKGYGIKKPCVVPDESYYVLGDNRSNSLDSRYFGPVPRKLIIGKVIEIYWPPKEMRTLSTSWKDVNAKAD
ncbi:MAG: signal peptidase I [Sedimentisphaerales bacterium]